MRNYALELEQRVAFIQKALSNAGAKGIVFGNSGGKDSALVGILCKKACENTFAVIMPCHSRRNFGEDKEDGLALSQQFGIETITVDLTEVRSVLCASIGESAPISDAALGNIAPRLRMTTLYAIAQSRGALVAGTGNRSENYMGYFTKWGDGAYDLNPIADLTASEVLEFLRFLDAPAHIVSKAPSAGLFEGQTDEQDMGVTYAQLDHYLATKEGEPEAVKIIEGFHARSHHKRRMPLTFSAEPQ